MEGEEKHIYTAIENVVFSVNLRCCFWTYFHAFWTVETHTSTGRTGADIQTSHQVLNSKEIQITYCLSEVKCEGFREIVAFPGKVSIFPSYELDKPMDFFFMSFISARGN